MRRSIAIACAVLSLCTPMRAQALRPLEISGGYAFLNDPHAEVAFRRGWLAGVDVGVRGWLSAAGEVCGLHAHVEGIGDDTDLSIHSLLAGPRASVRLGPLRESFQILAGVSRTSGRRFGVTETRRLATLQPGAAVDLRLRGRLWIRGQIDVRLFLSDVDSDHQLRAVAALVYRRE